MCSVHRSPIERTAGVDLKTKGSTVSGNSSIKTFTAFLLPRRSKLVLCPTPGAKRTPGLRVRVLPCGGVFCPRDARYPYMSPVACVQHARRPQKWYACGMNAKEKQEVAKTQTLPTVPTSFRNYSHKQDEKQERRRKHEADRERSKKEEGRRRTKKTRSRTLLQL